MNKPLTVKQRNFLIYLRNNHKSVGMYPVIFKALKENSYDEYIILEVVENFKALVNELYTGKNTHRYCIIQIYNKPTKYVRK